MRARAILAAGSIGLLACAPAALGHGGHPRQAGGAQAADSPEGRTTLELTVGGERGSGFTFPVAGAGEPHIVREDGVGTAQPGREARRRSLAYFGQLTDFQVSDEESPARVEFVDISANDPFPRTFSAAWRPQEAFVAHGVDQAIRNMNRFTTSPVAQGDGRKASMAFALMTGDLADNQQFNETEWVRTLLEGGTLDPNSGSSDPADYAGCPPGTPGPAEAANYTGVQDYDDYAAGTSFYDPDQPLGPWAGFPTYPGLMDRAQRSFEAAGLQVPSYVTFGNHDGLAQGNQAANASFEAVGVGCVKPLAPAANPLMPQAALDPAYLQTVLGSDKVALVPPDPDRRYVDKREFKQVYSAGRQADDHGFAFVDPVQERASNGGAAYYAWDALPGFRFVSIDTLSEGGVAGPSSNGNLDDPQFGWLRRELAAAEEAGKLVVVFGHHPIRSLNAAVADELAPPCTAPDSHGHDVNPGCDIDPRDSSPIRDGDDLRELLLAHRGVIAYVAGHTHENAITAFPRESGGGFWGIETPSLVDWPPQSRLLEIMDNGDGTLSIFGTIIDTAAPIAAPAPGTSAADFDARTIASVGRAVAFNDPQAGGGTGEGRPIDRNVELLVADPRAAAAAAPAPAPPAGGDEEDGAQTRRRTAGAPERAEAAGGGGSLPFTGGDVALVAAAGAGLLGLGLLARAIVLTRRERMVGDG